MKLLTTEKQEALRELLVHLGTKQGFGEYTLEEQNQLAYWAIELKPKRVRRLTPPQSD